MSAVNTLAPTDSIDPGEFARRAQDLLPRLRERAGATELARRMPAETIADLRAAGFHRLYMPRRWGGYECDWGAHFAVSSILGEACGSTAWTTSLVFSHVMFLARFPGEAQEEVLAREREPVVATGSAGGGTLRREGAGWRFAGRWGFVSGIHHAHCAMVTGRLGDAPAPTHFVLLLPGEFEIEDTWHAEGLRGTGSHHIRVTDRAIPAHRVIGLFDLIGRDPPGSRLHDGWLYRARMAPLQKSWFAGPLVGTARGALREFLATTRSRRGQIFGESVAEQVPVQIEIGESLAEVDTAALLAREMCARLGQAGASGADFIGDDLLWLRRASAMVAKLCTTATHRLAGAMGASGQVGHHPVQRLYRDCRMVASHVELNWHHSMAPSGKRALGLPTGDPLVDGGPVATPGLQLGTQV